MRMMVTRKEVFGEKRMGETKELIGWGGLWFPLELNGGFGYFVQIGFDIVVRREDADVVWVAL